MNADMLLAHYERIAEAPDAITRLRRFVLDLAVRGKLVPQEAGDEPAAELLKRSLEAKKKLASVGGLRASKLAAWDMAPAPYGVPETWVWCALSDVCHYDAGDKCEPRELIRDRWLLDLEDVEKDTGRVLAKARVSERASLSTKSEFQAGDILYGKLRPYLNKVLVADEPGYSTTEIVAIRPYTRLSPAYCTIALRRPDFVSYVTKLGQGTKMPRLRTEDAMVAPFPLPPLAEQHRIVAKVDELMALCDRLEAARTAREATRDRLAAASLARLNSPDPETFQHGARFTLNALPTLTTRPDQIKQLRQTILNLAVQGKLVPQEAEDEPVTAFLARVAAKAGQRGGGRSVRQAIQLVDPSDTPYLLPNSWAWLRFGEITVCRDGDRIPVSREDRSQRAKTYDYYGASGVIDQIDGYLFDKPLLLIGEDGANLVSRSSPIAFMAFGKYWVNNHAHVIDGITVDFLRYLELYINAIDLKPFVTGTAQPKMNQAKMNSIPVALPPEPEQRRIVAKVNVLMTLCDQLEASLTTTSTTRARLLEATLREALLPAATVLADAAE